MFALHVAQFREFVMNDLVDRILSIYQLMRPLDPDRVSDSRQRITRYIESLASAGQSDAQQLAVYGLAYLKETARGARPSVYRLLGCASPWIMTASTPHRRAAEYPVGTLACPHRLKTKATGHVSRGVAHASFGSFR
jgi:hypothetical protein